MGAHISVVPLSIVPVEWLIWQRASQAPVLTIACRATFTLRPGQATLAPEQEPIAASEQPYPDGSSRGVYAPCDLVPMKPRADVVLVGHAFAPGGQPVRSLVARLGVGEMEKRVEVFADRHFDQQGELREGPRFTRMRLVYERAAGGPDTSNPIGVRSDARDTYGRIALPNLQPTGLEIAAPGTVVPPTGFAPIPSAWPTRRALLGPAASAQISGEWQRPAVPADLDPAYFLAAPHDQQLRVLRDDERLSLIHLSPQHPELVTRLPGVRPRTFVDGKGGPQPVAMRADTLWIDATRQICSVTWRGHLSLDGVFAALRVLVALETPERPLGWEDVERLAASVTHGRPGRDGGHGAAASAATMMGIAGILAPALPFAGAGAGATQPFYDGAASGPKPRAPAEPFGGAGATQPFGDAGSTQPFGGATGPLPFGAPFSAALPFAPAPSPDPRAPREPTSDAGLPFRRPGGSVPAPPLTPLPPPLPADVPGEGSPTGALHAQLFVAPLRPDLRPDVPTPAPPPAPVESLWARGAAPVMAGTAPPMARPEPAPASPVPVVPMAVPRAVALPRAGAADPLQLVWLDPEVAPLLRRDPDFAPILDAMEERPLDLDLDDPALAADAADLDARRETFEILARGRAVGEEGVTAALAGSAGDDGRVFQPLVLVAGELVFPADELETLKATLSATAPYAGVDVEARAILDLAKEFLASPGQPSAPAVAEGLATRIRETFDKRGILSASFIETQVGRALLAGRRTQQRALLGAKHVRAVLQTGAGSGIPTYLDPAAAAELPAAERRRVRLLARVYHVLDQHETHPAALHVVALALVNPPLFRR